MAQYRGLATEVVAGEPRRKEHHARQSTRHDSHTQFYESGILSKAAHDSHKANAGPAHVLRGLHVLCGVREDPLVAVVVVVMVEEGGRAERTGEEKAVG